MDKFFADITQVLENYYESIVSLMPRLAMAILVLIITYFIANSTKKLVARRFSPKMDDPLLAKFLSRVAKVIILSIGILFVLNIIGLGGIAGGLMASAGVGAFVIGFAFRDIGENFLAGIILAFDRPFRIGDTVELDGQKGLVVTLNLRNTQIKTFDGKDIYIPNADVIKNPVVNYTIDGFLRHNFTIGLGF
jgi:small conductance mechanosensitive channel